MKALITLLLILAWAVWQAIVLFLAVVLFGNLFGEYGVYSNEVATVIGAAVLFLMALWTGTWVPFVRWRTATRQRRSRLRST